MASASSKDYEWGNPRPAQSLCDDWLFNLPTLKGQETMRVIDKRKWGEGDMTKHHIWWLNHTPKASGVGKDGLQLNWWKYICDFNHYPETNGRSK